MLFGIPGFFVSGIISLVVFGAVIGMLWIFVFGDSPWPLALETILSIILAMIFLIAWITLITGGYWLGKKLEKDPAWNWKHIWISGGLTLAFILLLVLQQWSVGNIGPKSESMLCSDFCVQHGYSGSGTPPQNSGEKTCSCFDNSGNEALKVPLDHIDPDFLK